VYISRANDVECVHDIGQSLTSAYFNNFTSLLILDYKFIFLNVLSVLAVIDQSGKVFHMFITLL